MGIEVEHKVRAPFDKPFENRKVINPLGLSFVLIDSLRFDILQPT